MTFSLAPRGFFYGSLARVNSLGLLVAAMVLLGGSACENKHIGRPCGLSVDPDAGTTTGTTATLDVALECPSRICLLPAQEAAVQTPPTTSLCTADCSSDDDCADGERRNTGDTSDARCKGGFVCKVAETVGDFCCRRLCVCTDFLLRNPLTQSYDTSLPDVCQPTPANKALCKNLQ
jgi:hypothetical protein